MIRSSSPEIQFFFQPFSALEFNPARPVMCVVFEGQHDTILANSFPEVEGLRVMLDNVRDRGEETVSLFGAQRQSQPVTLGVIYIRQSWRRRRGKTEMEVDSINFYRELFVQTRLAADRIRAVGLEDLVVVLPSRFRPENIRNDRRQEQRLERFAATMAEAVTYANFTLDEKVSDAPKKLKSVSFTHFGEEDREITNFFNRAISEGQALGEATGRVRQLTVLPSNLKLGPQFFSRAVGVTPRAKTTKAKTWHRLTGHSFSSCTKISYLYGKEALERFGLGLIHGVAKGSAREPYFLKLHYKPVTSRQKKVKRVVIVGKGIVFDTGGTNIKYDEHLNRMNYDMAGAAMAIQAVKMADQVGLPVEVIALAPILENANGPEAVRTGDVLTAYDGKTVEIVDTDCEGRLVLGDGVAYSERRLNPDATVTIGTLGDMTGMGPDLLRIGIGNDKLWKKVVRAENRSAEKMTLLPSLSHLNEVYNEHQGSVSDLVNWPGGYYDSSPFIFIYHFFNSDHPEWVFMDPSALFEANAENYGAGPGFGLKFIWYLLKQYA